MAGALAALMSYELAVNVAVALRIVACQIPRSILESGASLLLERPLRTSILHEIVQAGNEA